MSIALMNMKRVPMESSESLLSQCNLWMAYMDYPERSRGSGSDGDFLAMVNQRNYVVER